MFPNRYGPSRIYGLKIKYIIIKDWELSIVAATKTTPDL